MEKVIDIIEEKKYQEIKNIMNKENDYFTAKELDHIKNALQKVT